MINKLFGKWYFPLSLKFISLIAYVGLIIIGFTAYSSDSVFLNQLRNTNLGNLIVWSYWWPAIIILAIFFGRIWCMVCPVEIITTFFAKIGLRKKRPKWMLSGWVITIFYILILFLGIHGFAVHRNPTFMAFYLLIIAGVSIIIGSIYEKNTFCRYVCPVGHLLGLYSRLSFLGWRVKDKKVCDTCKDKSCIHKNYQHNLNFKSCGVDLYPANIQDNTNCILCGGCLKTCKEYQSESNPDRPNPQFQKVGFASDLLKLNTLKYAELVFILIVSGFVIYEIWVEWSVSKNILLYIPKQVSEILSFTNPILFGLIKSIIIFVVAPFIIWILPFIIAQLFKNKIKLKDYFVNYGIAFIPIIAAAHLNKAILKTTSRLPYFEHVKNDIQGINTAQKIVDGEIILRQLPAWSNQLISILLIIIIAAGIGLSIKLVKMLNHKHNKSVKTYYLIPLLYGSVFLIMLIIWRWNYLF